MAYFTVADCEAMLAAIHAALLAFYSGEPMVAHTQDSLGQQLSQKSPTELEAQIDVWERRRADAESAAGNGKRAIAISRENFR